MRQERRGDKVKKSSGKLKNPGDGAELREALFKIGKTQKKLI